MYKNTQNVVSAQGEVRWGEGGCVAGGGGGRGGGGRSPLFANSLAIFLYEYLSITLHDIPRTEIRIFQYIVWEGGVILSKMMG